MLCEGSQVIAETRLLVQPPCCHHCWSPLVSANGLFFAQKWHIFVRASTQPSANLITKSLANAAVTRVHERRTWSRPSSLKCRWSFGSVSGLNSALERVETGALFVASCVPRAGDVGMRMLCSLRSNIVHTICTTLRNTSALSTDEPLVVWGD